MTKEKFEEMQRRINELREEIKKSSKDKKCPKSSLRQE